MRNYKRFFIPILSFVLLYTLFIFLPVNKAYGAQTQRLAGADRYNTAIEISKSGWQTAENVVLATGEDFPDALSAAPLAKKLDAPILLTGKVSLGSALETELDRLQAKNIFIVGGEGVISRDIQNKLEQKKLIVTRLSGVDRYDTSLKIAKYTAANFDLSSEIVIATGEDFPDALSIAPIAASKGMPIILSPKASLPESIKAYIAENQIRKEYVIGGIGVVSEKVKEQLQNPERMWGADRYETNTAVLKYFSLELNYDTTYAATGIDFPDALAGSALAAKTMSPIILTDTTAGKSTLDFVESKLASINQLKVLGGEGVVPKSVLISLVPPDNERGSTTGNLSNLGLAA